MYNQIDFTQNPNDLFLNPARDAGLTFLKEPEFIWRAHDPAVIKGFAASAHASVGQRIQSFLTVTERHKTFDKAIEINTVPVLLRDAWFRKSHVVASGKFILSGASGIRLLNRYCWKNQGAGRDPEQVLRAFFSQSAADPENAVLSPMTGALPQGLGFAIECRNTFNYYHFLTESLGQLCLVAESGVQGPIYFHYPNQPDKTRSFVMDFVEQLFPELVHRIRFERAPWHHDAVISPFNFANAYFQLPESVVGNLDDHAPSDQYWQGRVATRSAQSVLSMNSFDASLKKLRARALAAIAGKDFDYLPKRFWVGRDEGKSRLRKMDGEDEILEMLGLFGFVSVAFERLSPLEQIALLANAEMMVSYHGAGFANMLFANPEAYIVELGTLQTATFRWGDFWRCAHVSGCRYISFFADYNTPNPEVDPHFSHDGIVPVRLSQAGLAQVMSFIVMALGKTPVLNRAEDVARLGRQMVAVGAYRRAAELFEKHNGLEVGDLDLSLARAEAYEKLGQYTEQLASLYCAYRADPTRWGTLVQVIWCARKTNDFETIRAGLAVLREAFPERFQAFIKDRPWFQKLVD